MTAIQPLEQGISQPVGYGRPPVATRFRPGRSGNPAGRPTAGASLREWLNVLQDWTVGDLRALAAHPRTGAMKRAAAVTWIAACSSELTPAGMPVAGPALDFILKHTSGRPGRADRGAGNAGAVLQPARPPVNVAAIGAELLALAGRTHGLVAMTVGPVRAEPPGHRAVTKVKAGHLRLGRRAIRRAAVATVGAKVRPWADDGRDIRREATRG